MTDSKTGSVSNAVCSKDTRSASLTTHQDFFLIGLRALVAAPTRAQFRQQRAGVLLAGVLHVPVENYGDHGFDRSVDGGTALRARLGGDVCGGRYGLFFRGRVRIVRGARGWNELAALPIRLRPDRAGSGFRHRRSCV